jgi:hypothetical protein
MSQSLGPNINNSGLIFSYDVTDTANSFKGGPTVNLSYNNGQGGSEYLVAPITWVNAGSWEYNDNETDVPKPLIPGVDTTNLRVISGKSTATSGSVHFGCGFTYLSPSTTYTVSVWYRQNRAGASQPYLRTNITNAGLANLSYNGNTDSSTWPANQWIRISASGTTASNEDGLYISNYIGTHIGDKIWYFGHQVEQKNHMTSLVVGSRSTTQSIVDVTGNSTITMTNGGFDSNGQIYFDGSNSYGIITNGPMSTITGDVTLAGWFYWNGGTGAPHRTIICTDTAYRHGVKLMSYYHGGLAAWVGNNNGSNDYLLGGGSTPLNSWNMLACTYNIAGGLILYLNGQSINSANTGFLGGTARVSTAMIGREYHSTYEGKLPLSMAYNRILSSSEINKLYINTKSKFI